MPTSKKRAPSKAAQKKATRNAERRQVPRCHACSRAATATVQPTLHTDRTLHVCAWHKKAWVDYEAGQRYSIDNEDDDSDRKQIWMGYRSMPFDVDDDEATVTVDGDGNVVDDEPTAQLDA